MIRCMRVLTLTVVVAVALTACGGDDDDAADSASESELPSAWTDEGIAALEAVAADVEAAGIACADYTLYDYDVTIASNPTLPVPAAMATCTSDNDENFEFIAFADEDAKQEFVDTKQELLCNRAEEEGLDAFPGFLLVDGGTWTIQPDHPTTSEALAGALAAESVVVDCD